MSKTEAIDLLLHASGHLADRSTMADLDADLAAIVMLHQLAQSIVQPDPRNAQIGAA